MLIVLLLVWLLACVLLMLHKQQHAHKLPPAYYKSLPLIGVTHLLMTDTSNLWKLFQSVSEDTKRQGGITWTKIGNDMCYLITDPEDALTVANTCLEKHHSYKFMECVFGRGLITAPVPKWQRHRKLVNPAFSLPILHGYLETFNRQTEKLISQIDQYADKGFFEPSSFIQNISLQTACLTTFGTISLDKNNNFELYAKAIHEIIYMSIQRFQKFWLQSDLFYKLCGLQHKQDKLVKTFNELTNKLIQKATLGIKQQQNYKNDVENTTGATSFLEKLLPLRENNILSEEEFRDEVNTTVIAAFDTTAVAFQTTLVMIGSHPEVQERLYEEIIRIVGPERDAVKDDLSKLVYTEAVIKETLRFITVIPFAARYIHQDVKLKNYTARAGSQCIIFSNGINRDAVWGPDADVFRPERWLEPDSLPETTCAFAGFSIGKRNCIGKIYALTSLKVSLVHLVRKYRMMADHTKLQFKLEITLKPFVGHEISLQRRNVNEV